APGSQRAYRRATGPPTAGISRRRSPGPGRVSCQSSLRRAPRTPRRRVACPGRRPGPTRRPRHPQRPPTGHGLTLSAAAARLSIGVLLCPAPCQRYQDDLDVERKTPILYVIEVVDQPFFHRRLATEVFRLGPARKTGTDEVAVTVAGQLFCEGCHERRALRARSHQAHVAHDDVSELRQLIQ